MARINSLFDIVNTITSFISSTDSLKSIQLEAEVSEIKEYPSVVYLTVLDAISQVTIRAIIFKTDYVTKLKIGSKIAFQGAVKFYKNEIQISIKSYVLTGLGTAINSLNKLKEELAVQGYYDNKKDIVDNYSRIGIVSSLNSAGLKDFVHTINSRSCGKEIFIYPATVQGPSAPDEIQKAIALANKHNKAQVLAVIRGGGSKEDLECFNDKLIAKAIHESNLPIVTGIGHQIDISIADLVADKHFITPTATAQGLTAPSIFDQAEISAEATYVNDLFVIKLRSFYEYLEESEEKVVKYVNRFTSDLDSKVAEHSVCLDRTREHLQSVCDQKANYFMDVDNKLSNMRDQLVQKIDNCLETHSTLTDIMETLIGSKINCYSNSVSLLGRPIIKSKQSGREIRMVSDLKKGRKYILQFLDGTYEIKLT